MKNDRPFSDLLQAVWYNDELSAIIDNLNIDREKAHLVLCGKIGAIMKEKKCDAEQAVAIYGNSGRRRK